MNQAVKDDIIIAVNIWKDMLLDFFKDDIEYIYAKGSSLKEWDSIIDYVPQISDVDIHVKLVDNQSGSLLHPSLETSLKLGREYETRFINHNKNINRSYLHLPRIQMVLLDKIVVDMNDFVYPRYQDVHVLFGKPAFPREVEYDYIRKVDKNGILKLNDVLLDIPIALRDRSDKFEYYNLLRRMNYYVSPSPVRLLSQLLLKENPYNIWTWNRTTIKKNLEALSLDRLANVYEKYYLIGWELFKEQFNNNAKFQSLIATGMKVLELVYNENLKLVK